MADRARFCCRRRCRTCGLSPSAAICVDCFRVGGTAQACYGCWGAALWTSVLQLELLLCGMLMLAPRAPEPHGIGTEAACPLLFLQESDHEGHDYTMYTSGKLIWSQHRPAGGLVCAAVSALCEAAQPCCVFHHMSNLCCPADAGGCCDCGDMSSWRPSGCCRRHRSASTLKWQHVGAVAAAAACCCSLSVPT